MPGKAWSKNHVKWTLLALFTGLLAMACLFRASWLAETASGGAWWLVPQGNLPGWTRQELAVDADERQLDADELSAATYQSPRCTAQVLIANCYNSSVGSREIFAHTPDSCWVGNGWKREALARPTLDIAWNETLIVQVERRIYSFAGRRELVYFGGLSEGRPLLDPLGRQASWIRARRFWSKEYWERFVLDLRDPRAATGARQFFRVSTPIGNDNVAAADVVLQSLLLAWLEPREFGERLKHRQRAAAVRPAHNESIDKGVDQSTLVSRASDIRITLIMITIAVLSAIAARLARSIALKRMVLDIPNDRSSHTVPTPRLGGAAFVPFVLLGVWFGADTAPISTKVLGALLGGSLGLFVVSLIDDLKALSTRVRFGVQLAAAAVLVWAIHDVNPNGLVMPGFPIGLGMVMLVFWIVGLVNVYNFMDGIDGIAGLQAVVAGLMWFFIAGTLEARLSALLALCVVAGAVGFLTLNWPPAKIFMGDAGSIVLGYCFAGLPLLVVAETGSAHSVAMLLGAAVLSVWPFLADGAFTFAGRLLKRENILQAHRSHLYQRLVVAGNSHARVAVVYAALAVIGSLLAWRFIYRGIYAGVTAILVPGICFVGLWTWVVMSERAKACSDTR